MLRGGVNGGFCNGLGVCGSVMSVCVVSLYSLCTEFSILLHFIDICFLPYICLWQISHIQTCLCVVV